METIKNYLDNIFKALPDTAEMLRLKSELLGDMEAKYHELRQYGKTENEAIGIVIGEFGNIDELLNEMDISCADGDSGNDAVPVVTITEAREFLELSSKVSTLVGTGVAIIMIGVSALIGFYGLLEGIGNIPFPHLSENVFGVLPVVFFLIMIIPAVALFIYSGSLTEKYKYIETGNFNLAHSAKSCLEKEQTALKPKNSVSIIAGVSLCILAAALLIILSAFGDSLSTLGVSLLLIIVAVAVFIFIRSGSVSSAYEKLLKTGDFAPEDKVIGAISGIVWPIAVCIFLAWGFIYDGWSISWVVFPITGVLFGGFTALYSSLNKK